MYACGERREAKNPSCTSDCGEEVELEPENTREFVRDVLVDSEGVARSDTGLTWTMVPKGTAFSEIMPSDSSRMTPW